MFPIRLAPALAVLFSAATAQAASVTATGSANLIFAYSAGVEGASIVVPLGGESLTRAAASGVLSVDKFDPALGTLTDIRVQNFVSGTLELSRIVVTEGTVLADFDTDVRGNVYFDFPKADETPDLLGLPVDQNAPLRRPDGGSAFLATLDRSASLGLTPAFVDIGPTKPTAQLGPTDASARLFPENLAWADLYEAFTGTGEVDIDVGVLSTALLLIDCYGAGACQGSVKSTFNIAFDSIVTYDYEPFDTGGDGPAVVPVPAALPLFLTGLAGFGYIGWRRSRRAAPPSATVA